MPDTVRTQSRESAFPHDELLDSVLSCRTAEMNASVPYARHTVWERLKNPRFFLFFPIEWMDDRGRILADHGFCVSHAPDAPARCMLLFRSGLRTGEAASLSFLTMLETQLSASPSVMLCMADRDPSTLSDGESMRFCRAFLDGIRRHFPSAPPLCAEPELPPRERGYLGLLPPPVFSDAQAYGFACACFVREAVHLGGQGSLSGKTYACSGSSAIADGTGHALRRMGALPSADGETADIFLLFQSAEPLDATGADRLIARRPDIVAEVSPLACDPAAAQRLCRAGIVFIPGVALRAPAAKPLPAGLSDWQVERILRTDAETLCRKLHGTDADAFFRNTCAEALRTAADELVRKGV